MTFTKMSLTQNKSANVRILKFQPLFFNSTVRAYLQREGHTRLHIRTRHPPVVRKRPLDRSNRSNHSTFVRVTDARDAFT